MNFSFCQFRPKFNFENQIKENMQTKQNSHLEVDQGKKKLESTPSNWNCWKFRKLPFSCQHPQQFSWMMESFNDEGNLVCEKLKKICIICNNAPLNPAKCPESLLASPDRAGLLYLAIAEMIVNNTLKNFVK